MASELMAKLLISPDHGADAVRYGCLARPTGVQLVKLGGI